MDKFEEIKELILENHAIINFADFGEGVSEVWIKKAEERLNVMFPPSYVWWLKNYGGGEVLGEEIYSVYEMDFDTVVGGDIVYINELNRKTGIGTEDELEIQITDTGETFYFDLLNRDSDGELIVYRKFAGTNTKYADNFLLFLERRIKDKY